MCVDECPTNVFEFNEYKRIPEVLREKECFACLSCSEICPATAITHKDIVHSEECYHDKENLDLASRLAVNVPLPNTPMDDEHRKAALEDLGIRLLAVAYVFRQTLGGSLPAIGTMAGRALAGQLPGYRIPGNFQEALDLAVQQFAPTWDLNPDYNGNKELVMNVKTCFIRDLCIKRQIEPGGDLCVLFYNYLAGYLGKMGNARLKLKEIRSGGEVCVCDIEVFSGK